MRLRYSDNFDIDVHHKEELVMWLETRDSRDKSIFVIQSTLCHPFKCVLTSTLHCRIIINAKFGITTAKLLTALLLL